MVVVVLSLLPITVIKALLNDHFWPAKLTLEEQGGHLASVSVVPSC